ncbi:hypothetical protein BB560_005522, partial [Smittium megazygosporum]
QITTALEPMWDVYVDPIETKKGLALQNLKVKFLVTCINNRGKSLNAILEYTTQSFNFSSMFN